MYQIICPDCANATKFESLSKRPEECSFCFATFSKDIACQDIEDNRGMLCGLELEYQSTNEKITLKGDFNLLGRQNIGREVLSKILFNGIPVISRKHCSVSLINGKFFLKDEGSTNGTYYSLNKVDCTKEICEIENGSLIFLGQEAFLAKHIFKKEEKQESTVAEEKIKRYRCNEGCGYESEKYEEICPNCMTSNSMVEIS